MTALTTLLALVPMAVRPGAGAELLQPLAISVIGGLATGTLLTLFIIPVVYVVLEQLLSKVASLRAN
jgi:HAE1 family hydrophobic/amphiphilic exporter-1